MDKRNDPQIRLECLFTAKLTLSEHEARALSQLFGYGVDQFLKVFYEHLGRAYLEPHEHGLREFARTIDRDVGPHLRAIDVARKAIYVAMNTTCDECKGIDGRHYTDCARLKP